MRHVLFIAYTTTIGALVSGFVISKLWLWFVVSVPQFHVVPFTIGQAYGISFFITWFRLTVVSESSVVADMDLKKNRPNDYSDAEMRRYMNAALMPAIYLGIGFVAKTFLHAIGVM